jgi:membrane protein YdbS with pleckstrin-like domain
VKGGSAGDQPPVRHVSVHIAATYAADVKTITGPDVAWHSVSSALPNARTVAIAVVAGIPLLVAVVLLWWLAPATTAALVTALAVLSLALLIVLARRNARSWAYFEGPEELLIRNGRLIRKVVTVPYGRMQLVDLATSPIGRKFGIASVQLHTAAATSHARIHGVPVDEAEGLRQRLVQRGQAFAEGL